MGVWSEYKKTVQKFMPRVEGAAQSSSQLSQGKEDDSYRNVDQGGQGLGSKLKEKALKGTIVKNF